MKHNPQSLAYFARDILNRPLYPYQVEIAEAILASVLGGHGRIISVMMARQAGKNQLSALVEAYLLSCLPAGTIVKAAPTFTPQILTSRLRLLSLLDAPYARGRLWTSSGYMVGLSPQSDSLSMRAQTGPRVLFYSAGPESHVVGATADLLLEIDEAQDVAQDKFDRDFRPMASVNNATTVLYGTAATEETLLARQRALNLERERQTGQRTHFEYDWRTLAAFNPAYRSFVEQEIARLGEDHPTIQTQYLLRPVRRADSLLTPLQQSMLQGNHAWEEEPSGEYYYIAGMDAAGEERPLLDGSSVRSRQRDSTVLSIARVSYTQWEAPGLDVVHQYWWTGMPYTEQYAAAREVAAHWDLRALVIDATGLGATLASLLENSLGGERVTPFTFSRPSKSRLTSQLLALLNSGRFKLYAPQQAPRAIYEECWQQLRLARYRSPAPEVLDMYVDPASGHDDFLISPALLAEGLNTLTPPPVSALVRPRPRYNHQDRF